MFERRLKWFCILIGLAAAAIVARLAEIQVVRASEYRSLAERVTARPVRYLRAVRGTIIDRCGRVLVRDEPAFDISLNFGVLAGREDYLEALARRMRRLEGPWRNQALDDVLSDLRMRVQHTWERLSELSGQSIDELLGRADAVRDRVERIAEAHRRRRGIPEGMPAPVREEFEFHPIIEDVSHDLALAVRTEMERDPWISVTAGSRRVAIDADDVAHLLGRVRPVSPDALEADPLRDDEARALRPGDLCGTSGIERLMETTLRGTRGRVVEDFDRSIVEWIEPIGGRDVRLTIDMRSQALVMRALADAVALCANPSGAAAVVLDARTREILVLASYPTYRLAEISERYDELRRDTRTNPLLFRAAAAQYPPGSTCKVAALMGGLSEKLVHATTTVECRGYMDTPDAFRCWIYNQHRMAHGPQTPEQAVRNSCNIFFYVLGERMGAERLCDWFARFGLGRTTGSGLAEEARGIVPNAKWLEANQGRTHQRADARNYAIGQGEVTVTPLQAANVAASIAMGRWAPVRLTIDELGSGADATPGEPFDESALRLLRRGMWRVVNDNEGTAKGARLETAEYELCGKTGSAQTVPNVLRSEYELEWPDGRREKVIAPTREDALAPFAAQDVRCVGHRAVERYPELLPGERMPSHAWFIGFTQTRDTPRGEPPRGRVLAIAVIVEFAGSGGQAAGPVAARIADAMLTSP